MISVNRTPATVHYKTRFTINTALDADAWAILRKYHPAGTKKLGAFISRLLYEFEARAEAREELRRAALAAEAGEQPGA
jgi:hypothetical protein